MTSVLSTVLGFRDVRVKYKQEKKKMALPECLVSSRYLYIKHESSELYNILGDDEH